MHRMVMDLLPTLEQAREAVAGLVADYSRHRSAYVSMEYTEVRARQDFIDKFFVALGWDVTHHVQKNPFEQEVKVEPNVNAGTSQRRADYAFYIAPNFRDVRFYAEAKKPSMGIANKDYYFQTVRYGWNSRTPIAVLTNFEELHIVDCRYRPDIDNIFDARIKAYTYRDYISQEPFAEIFYLLSREAVKSGSLEKRSTELPKKRGELQRQGPFALRHQAIDQAFLEELDFQREGLAVSLKKENPALDGETLTELAQRTLDRLVFLRFLEDKFIESKESVSAFRDRNDSWDKFLAASKRLDRVYNGIVFKNHALLDSPKLTVDSEHFANLCARLSQEASPYDFNVIPIHILGSIYERFLGKVIVASAKSARVEYKPEVRKAGGVYYTPEYIVRYIVERTVGPLLAGKTPAQLENLKVIDIACGSGSFLLGAFELLLEYHQHWYNDNRDKVKRGDCFQHEDGTLHLTLAKRRSILLNNIFGVDIDPQAVEVAQLALYLKLLEEETTASARFYQLEIQETLLPNLAANIVCGNSIIEPDILARNKLARREQHQTNPMDFRIAFKQIMDRGGFDAVIGNPPYRREKDFKHLLDQVALSRFGARYRVARMDLWYYFVHRSLDVLRPGGHLGYIVNSYWTSGTGASVLISALKNENHVDEIFVLGKAKVFEKVSGQHMILRVTRGKSRQPTSIRTADSDAAETAESYILGNKPTTDFDKTARQLFQDGKVDLARGADDILDIFGATTRLAELGRIRQGIAENPASINKKTNARFGNRWAVGAGVFALNSAEVAALRLPANEQTLLRQYHDLKDIGRYRLGPPSLTLIYSSRQTCPDIAAYPILRRHLERYRDIMLERRETKNGANKWWHLHWPRDEDLWRAPKVLALQMAQRPSFVCATEPCYVTFSVNVFVPTSSIAEHLDYFAAVLNSRLLWFWFSHFAKRRGVALEINGNVLSRAPIRRIDPHSRTDRRIHDEIVSLALQIRGTTNEHENALTDREKTTLHNRLASLDREIDTRIYQLYGLTTAQIAQIDRELPG